MKVEEQIDELKTRIDNLWFWILMLIVWSWAFIAILFVVIWQRIQ